MNIKRSLEQRLSGINKWSRVALMGISLLTAAASAQAYILTSDGCDPVAAGYVTVSLMSSNAAESRFHLSASGTNTSWKFTEWSFFDPVTYMAGYTPTSNPTRIIISNDVYGARATFKDITERYILTVLAGTGGTVDPSGTISNIVKDSTIPIAAFPASGYVFNGWTGVAGVADPASSNTTIRVSSQSTNALTANFLQRYSYTSLDPQGPGSGSIVTNMNSSTRYTAQPLEDPVRIPSDDTRRYACVGWSEGAGSGFPATGTNALYTISSVSSSFTNRWAWTNQYRLAVSASPGYSLITVGPYSFDALPQAVWFSENRIVKLSAVANSAYIFMGWILDGVSMPLGNGTLLVTNNSAHSVVAKFATPGADSDNDGLPDWWEAKFGLNATTYDAKAVPPDPSGPDGDPDHDGLSNLAEFQIQYTNKNWYSSPVNADTDGDGMDDAYENSSVGPTNKAELTQQGQVVSAGLDCGGFIWTSGDNFIASNDSYSRENGPYGNRDADYHWSTNSGYQLKNVPLTNYEEWKGPDGRPPVQYVTVTNGQTTVLGVTTNLYPFSDDRGPVKMMVPNQPPFNTTDPDTHDQSKGNLADTDGDRIDDGYEWSWDKWQQANSGYNEIFIVGCTNGVPVAITNTVHDWNSARYFNPGFPADYNDSMPVGDILYDYKTAKVSPNWYTTSREYNAWQPTAFSSTIPAAPHSILMNNPPADDIAPQRSSHPFLIDVDQDGLPDGYEVIFGYDPWAISTFGTPWTDGQDNPDGDWMAWSGTNDIAARSLTNKWALRNHEVYLQDGFQPMVAVDMTYPKCPKPDKVLGKGTLRSPTTEKYSNIDEMRGPDGLMERVPEPMADDATSPINYDSDGDGIWDGWENYVGLNPSNPGDIALDPDKDKLSNLQEFQSYYTSSTNRMALTALTNWMNKIFPTDPGVDPSPADTDTARGADTDGDGIKDGDEKTFFNGDTLAGVSVTNMTISVDDDGDSTLVETVYAYGAWVGTSFVGGGLNPASSDTDGDTLPDPYEASYAAGLDGTMGDAFKDPDGDGLQNYQEYWSCSVFHWQKDDWRPDLADYDNAYFFQGTPKKWDWSQRQYIPLFGPKIGTMGYAGAYPTEKDSDGDGMDDFYEIYHGLNPLFGTLDLVKCRDLGSAMAGAVFSGCDPFTQPWTAGHQLSDPDGDGLKNYEESPNSLYPSQSPRIHTDPTPLWMTDMNYDRSWVNLYYQPRVSVWYWAASPQPPPDYAFSFESNEGYDTDADGVSDKEELNVTKTDPLTPERPVKRRALYLPPGVPAYARTYPGFAAASSDPGGGYLPGLTMVTIASDALRSFTVEAWVRPLSPTSGTDQVVVERPLYIPPGNKMNLSPGLRLNFRLAISGDGKPYVSYTGDETEPIYGDPKVTAPMVLSTNWTHLAATYQVASYTNANQGGVLSLYVNGVLAVRSSFSQNPSTGSFYLGSPIVNVEGAPIVVGAADSNPNGTFGSTDEPMPSLFFKGWIDEVRVWDGARSVEQIQTTMRKQLKQSDVLAQQRPNPTLKYLYSFDGRPDVDHFATTTGTPLGFDVTAIKMFPSSWMAAFWDATPQKSLVYSDYRYVPWIANIATHTPEAFPCDIGDSNLIQNVMSGTNVVGQYAEFWNTSNPYGSRYTTYRQWLGQRLDQFNDLLPLGYAQADEDAPMWDNGTVPALIPYDSDGDGMPDGWEERYGLDPLDPNGKNGAYGDSDLDGLSNLGEFLASTSPNSWDSLGTGFSDYDNRSNAGSRTFGELFDDGDGMPASWEAQYAPELDPTKYDAQKDPDGDGWSNYAEYMGAWKAYNIMTISNGVGFVANTNNQVMVPHCDPLDKDRYPVPLVSITVKYNGRLGSSLDNILSATRDVRIQVYSTPSMDGYPDATLNLMQDANNDGIPDWWNARYNAVGAAADPDGDFLSNYDEYRYGMDPYNWDSDGDGISDGIDYSHSVNQSGAVVREFTTGHIREGNNYLFAYLDVNNDKQWQPDTEPAGIGQFQPVNLGWSDVNNVEICLSDSMPGYSRFSWPASATAKKYIVVSSAPALTMEIQAPRNYVHEGDFLKNGSYGFPAGFPSFDVYQDDMDHYITTVLAPEIRAYTLGTPSVVTPHGSYLTLARNEIEFKVDPNATSYRMQVALTAGGTPIASVTNIVPYRDASGVCKAPLPFYAGDNYVPLGSNYASSVWTNGWYWVNVQAVTPSASVSSPWSAINLNVQPPDAPPPEMGKSMISGEVYYFGKVSHGYGTGQASNLTILVQAFESPGFSGVADGQVQITTNCANNTTIGASAAANTNNVGIADKGPFQLKGLGNKLYHVRAFIDVNGNRQLDYWEPMGFARVDVSSSDYDVQSIDLRGEAVKAVSGVRVVIRDRDTDADKLPDGWEWMYYGTLTRGGGDTGAVNRTYWGTTNISLLRCYEIDPVDIDPTAADGDTDKDGVSDFDEVCYSDRIAGTAPDIKRYDPYPPSATSQGTDLNTMKWDTDGDGLSDGYELDHGLDPLNPNDGAAEIARASAAGETIPGVPRVSQIAAVAPASGQFALTWQAQVGMNYDVQYSNDLKTWLPALGLGTARYENGVYTYVDQSPKVATRFYRVVVR